MLSLCRRAQGDDQEQWLNDHENHIGVFDLAPPEGYSDMDTYNRELAEYLISLHADRREYLTQTLRNGTRVHDEIFFNGHRLIDKLLPRISEAISVYLSGWDTDPNHPFASRKTDGFRISGSWSSRTRTLGYHVNHIHPEGWISSCYYVGVPDAVKDETARQGWIKFGEPSFAAPLKHPIRRAIQPVPGRLVLFPSYTWHGTVPFHDTSARTTIAFDAVPV